VIGFSSEQFAFLPLIKNANIKVYQTVIYMKFCMGGRIKSLTSREVYSLKSESELLYDWQFTAKSVRLGDKSLEIHDRRNFRLEHLLS
jgi:hypothetical protein